MTINLEAVQSGYLLVDGGHVSQQINGFRFTLIRTADKAVFHFATARQVRQQLAS